MHAAESRLESFKPVRSTSSGPTGRLAVLGVAAIVVLSGCASPVRLGAPAPPQPAAPGAVAALPGPSGAAPAPAPSSAAVGSGALAQLQSELRQLVDQVSPSVVQIDSGGGLGSGVIVDAQGTVVTNAHVVGNASGLTVTTSDGHTYPGSVAGSYPQDDLALIHISGAAGLKPAVFGDSAAVRVGDIVLAIGSPLGLTGSVSEGIVSGVGRSESESSSVTLTNLIQMTAAINPGNSGGALVAISGQVIGIPTLGAGGSARGGSASGIGFAIPSSQVTNVIQQLAGGGTVTHSKLPYLGISTTSSSTGGGAQISSVVAGGPADKAGVKAGWVVTSLGGHPASDPAAISKILAGYGVGDKVALTARLPDGSTRTVTITVGERPANP